jgi:hypothetical protein
MPGEPGSHQLIILFCWHCFTSQTSGLCSVRRRSLRERKSGDTQSSAASSMDVPTNGINGSDNHPAAREPRNESNESNASSPGLHSVRERVARRLKGDMMSPPSKSDPPVQPSTIRGGRSPHTPVTSSLTCGSSQKCSLSHNCARHPAQSSSPAVNPGADRRTPQLSRPALLSQFYLPSDMSVIGPPQNPATSLSSQLLLSSGTTVIDPR